MAEISFKEQKESCDQHLVLDKKWPKISVITPSYNQGHFLEETLKSVISQGYPNLEYIVIDGGSKDNSAEIIKCYQDHIYYWVSEKDNGQSDAINKGMSKATGDILCWLNSDDLLKPGSLEFIAKKLGNATTPQWLIGSSELIDASGQIFDIRKPEATNFEQMIFWSKYWFPQQSTFWNRAMWEIAGPLDTTKHLAMDFSLWLTMRKYKAPIIVSEILSAYRRYEDCKSSGVSFQCWEEQLEISQTLFKEFKCNKEMKISLAQEGIRWSMRCLLDGQYFRGWKYFVQICILVPEIWLFKHSSNDAFSFLRAALIPQAFRRLGRLSLSYLAKS